MFEPNNNTATISTDKLIDIVRDGERAKAMVELMKVKAEHLKELEKDVWYDSFNRADADRRALHDQLDALEAENSRLKSSIRFIGDTKNG